MDDRLFEEIVEKVCSTLNLQAAISELQRVLKAHTGIEGVFLGHHAAEEKQVYNLVYADSSSSSDLNYTQPALDELQDYLLSEQRRELNMLSRLKDFPAMAKTLSSHIPLDHSLYDLRIRLDGQHIGMMAFHSAKPDISEPALELLMKIRGPIALNLANRLSQLQAWDQKAAGKRGVRDHGTGIGRNGAHIVGSSSAICAVYRTLDAAAATPSTILLTGETGVGKDVFARYVHSASPRRDRPFVHVNCGGIPESLIEAEFFGHRKGAFTGATGDRAGFFEQADGGTIFLDEIGELPLSMQPRLLQVLQDKTVRRVGDTRTKELDFRVIAATNCDLEQMCREGRFRRDLFFRLNCIKVDVPPLRKRKEDIPLLIESLLRTIAREHEISGVPAIEPRDMARLVRYDWPGNIRELENCLHRSLILNSGPGFHVDLAPSSCHVSTASRQTNTIPPPPAASCDAAPANAGETLQDHMRHHMEEALRTAEGRIHGAGGAAELLDINPSTLRSRLKKMGIPYGRQWS